MKFKEINNISIVWFTNFLLKNGPIPLTKIPLILLFYTKFILSVPLSLLKTFLVDKQIERTLICPDPVFILGHFRCGTSYLHKLLLADNNFGYLSNYDFLFPNLSFLTGQKTKRLLQSVINGLRIKNFHFNNYAFQLDDPNEEDLLIASAACRYTSSWGFVFPRNWGKWLLPDFFKKSFSSGWHNSYNKVLKELTFKAKGKRLLLKNPPNTGRVQTLLKLFPDAKFIYICRNPYHLYYSLRNLWKNAVCKYYALQKIDDEFLDKIIFEHFIAVNENYETEKYLIPKGNLIEISFEELEASPYDVIKRIYQGLNINGFNEIENKLREIIERESNYKKFDYKYSLDKFSIIEKYWGKYIRNGNYKRPKLII